MKMHQTVRACQFSDLSPGDCFIFEQSGSFYVAVKCAPTELGKSPGSSPHAMVIWPGPPGLPGGGPGIYDASETRGFYVADATIVPSPTVELWTPVSDRSSGFAIHEGSLLAFAQMAPGKRVAVDLTTGTQMNELPGGAVAISRWKIIHLLSGGSGFEVVCEYPYRA